MKALIIGYHCVKDTANSYLRPTTVADFANQMQYLSEQYTPISLEEMVRHLRYGIPLPPNAMSVTFDDGYRDSYENAFPILDQYKIPATIFLTTDFIGTGHIPAWENGHYRDNDRLMLSWEEVREMSDHGISFGSHTVTHPRLTTLDFPQVEDQLRRSKDVIEQQIGMAVTEFAYPSGNFNTDVKHAVEQAGYVGAVTTVPGHNGPHADMYTLKRNLIQLRSAWHKLFPLSFRAEVTGAVGRMRSVYYQIRKTRHRKSRLK